MTIKPNVGVEGMDRMATSPMLDAEGIAKVEEMDVLAAATAGLKEDDRNRYRESKRPANLAGRFFCQRAICRHDILQRLHDLFD